MKILLAADGSEFTRRAAEYLVTLAGKLSQRPEIHLLNVHAPIPYPRAAAVAGRAVVKMYQEEECAAALAVAEDLLGKSGIAHESAWVAGKAGEEIAKYAAQIGAGMIVMGSHGHGTLRTIALGSVADDVLRAAKCPVLIVK
jgi:nucleotide-binding universal stress UspA family protein